jgi:hypothetical protein
MCDKEEEKAPRDVVRHAVATLDERPLLAYSSGVEGEVAREGVMEALRRGRETKERGRLPWLVDTLLQQAGGAAALAADADDGCTALHLAMYLDFLPEKDVSDTVGKDVTLVVVQLLLRAGADPTATNRAGQTPLAVWQEWRSRKWRIPFSNRRVEQTLLVAMRPPPTNSDEVRAI